MLINLFLLNLGFSGFSWMESKSNFKAQFEQDPTEQLAPFP